MDEAAMDAMTRCSHGHFYDASKHSSCPYCGAGTDIEGKTRRVPSSPAVQQPKAAPPPPASDPGVTRAVYRETATGISPVVGWLVCVAGPGRGSSMDIVIVGDDSVSREKHASVAYDPKKRNFWLMPGEASGLVYLNEQLVNTPSPLKSRDTIEIGKTKLMFWPLCDDNFHWD